MTDDLNDPARAFDDLRREVSLALRAIQGLTAEHREARDYSETLKAFDSRLHAITQALIGISKSPAMTLTPENLTERSNAASVAARRNDADLVHGAAARMDKLSGQLSATIAQVRSARNQRDWLVRVGGVCFAVGFVVAMIFTKQIGW